MHLQQQQHSGDQAGQQEEGALPTSTVLQKRYEILELVGTGGFSIVYKARDLRFEKTSRICAVKEMYNTVVDPNLRSMAAQNFEREANVLASLSHPAIPSIFDYFSEGNRIYLVMEFIEGPDLEQIIDQSSEPIAQDKVIDWAIQICEVLSYLHSHKPEPYIFRDVKPSNIMLTEHNRIMLIDFGIAKVFRGAQRGTLIGTEGYTPPEQYRGAAEPRGDVYGLGATIHHLLTKRDPRFEAPFSFHERPIRSLNPDVSEALEAIVMKSLEYEVDKRFASAEEFRQALEGFVTPSAVAAPATIAFQTSTLSLTRTDSVLPVWEFACEGEIGSSPTVSDGVLYVGSFDHNLYAIDATDGRFIWKYATEAGITSSPHVWEDLVFVGSQDRLLYALFRDNGNIAWSTITGGPIHSSPRVAMAHVFFGSDDGFFYNLDAFNGRHAWRLEVGDHVRSSPAVSEELVYFGSDDWNVYAVNVQTGRQKWKFSTRRPVISSPLLHEGLLFFGSMDWNVYALDADTGWAVWNYRTHNWIVSSPAISEPLGLVYIGGGDRCAYAFNANRGPPPVWRFEAGGAIGSSPVIHGEAVYVGCSDGYLYSLDARTGELRWKFFTGDRVNSTPTVWGNMVFVGSRSKKIYALPL